jgi:hypothetical protein
MLLSGLVEQGARRRLMPLSAALEIKELRREVKDALYSALSLCHEVLERGGLEEHIRRLEARRVTSVASDPGGAALVARSGGQATSGQAQRRQAV